MDDNGRRWWGRLRIDIPKFQWNQVIGFGRRGSNSWFALEEAEIRCLLLRNGALFHPRWLYNRIPFRRKSRGSEGSFLRRWNGLRDLFCCKWPLSRIWMWRLRWSSSTLEKERRGRRWWRPRPCKTVLIWRRPVARESHRSLWIVRPDRSQCHRSKHCPFRCSTIFFVESWRLPMSRRQKPKGRLT